MIRVGSAILIRRALDEVFEFVTDAQNDALWVAFAREAAKLTPGPVRLGTRFRQTGEFLGVRVHTDWEITEFEPGRRMVGEAHSGALAFRGIYEFGPAAEGTRVCKSGMIEFHGLLALGEPFLSGLIQHALEADLRSLKAILERQAAVCRRAS